MSFYVLLTVLLLYSYVLYRIIRIYVTKAMFCDNTKASNIVEPATVKHFQKSVD